MKKKIPRPKYCIGDIVVADNVFLRGPRMIKVDEAEYITQSKSWLYITYLNTTDVLYHFTEKDVFYKIADFSKRINLQKNNQE